MESYATLILGIIGAVSTAAGVFCGKWWASRRKDQSQLHDQYMALFDRQNVRITVLEAENVLCRSENAKLQREVGAHAEALRRLEGTQQAAVIQSDENGVILHWNHVATVMLGWSADEAVGQPIDIIIPDRRHAEHHEAFNRAVSEKRGPRPATVILDASAKRRDGVEIPITIVLSGWSRDGKRYYQAELTRLR